MCGDYLTSCVYHENIWIALGYMWSHVILPIYPTHYKFRPMYLTLFTYIPYLRHTYPTYMYLPTLPNPIYICTLTTYLTYLPCFVQSHNEWSLNLAKIIILKHIWICQWSIYIFLKFKFFIWSFIKYVYFIE